MFLIYLNDRMSVGGIVEVGEIVRETRTTFRIKGRNEEYSVNKSKKHIVTKNADVEDIRKKSNLIYDEYYRKERQLRDRFNADMAALINGGK